MHLGLFCPILPLWLSALYWGSPCHLPHSSAGTLCPVSGALPACAALPHGSAAMNCLDSWACPPCTIMPCHSSQHHSTSEWWSSPFWFSGQCWNDPQSSGCSWSSTPEPIHHQHLLPRRQGRLWQAACPPFTYRITIITIKKSSKMLLCFQLHAFWWTV